MKWNEQAKNWWNQFNRCSNSNQHPTPTSNQQTHSICSTNSIHLIDLLGLVVWFSFPFEYIFILELTTIGTREYCYNIFILFNKGTNSINPWKARDKNKTKEVSWLWVVCSLRLSGVDEWVGYGPSGPSAQLNSIPLNFTSSNQQKLIWFHFVSWNGMEGIKMYYNSTVIREEIWR